MSDVLKNKILKSVYENLDLNDKKYIKADKIISYLDKEAGSTWFLEVNPESKKLKVDYDFEGKIYFSPNSNTDVKILIWRKDKNKKRGALCCCQWF